MVDAGGNAVPFKRPVLILRPEDAPVLQQGLAVPLARLEAAQAQGRCLPQREQDVRMVVARIVTFLEDRLMDRQVGDHTAADEDFLDERYKQFSACTGIELVRQRQSDLAGELCILAAFHPLDERPELLAVLEG